MPCGIYKIVCKIDSKVYIGRSVDIEKRWKQHRVGLCGRRHSNSHLQRAWDLYGEYNFSFEIVEECAADKTPEREAHWQSHYGIGDSSRCYNLLIEDGTGSFRIHEETKLKMSESLKGKQKTDEHRRSLSKATSDHAAIHGGSRKGMATTEEHRKKISETLKGRSRASGITERIQSTKAAKRAQGILPKPQPPHSEETRAKISENSKRKFDEYRTSGVTPSWITSESIEKANETRRRRREAGEISSPFSNPEVRERANETRRRNRELKLLEMIQKKIEKSDETPCPGSQVVLLVSCQDDLLAVEEEKSFKKVEEKPVQEQEK